MIIGVTGHRPNNLGGWRWNPIHAKVYQDLRRAFRHLRPTYIITGMALGVDQWAAEVAIELGVPFIAAVPFEGQEGVWPDAAKAKYRQILTKAFRHYIVSPGSYESWKMSERNKWIVQNCAKLIAVWDGSVDGGTSHCVSYAQKVGREIFYIDPRSPLTIPGEVAEVTASPEPVNQVRVSQTAAELIARTRAAHTPATPSTRTQPLGVARSPNAPSNSPERPNPFRRVIDID